MDFGDSESDSIKIFEFGFCIDFLTIIRFANYANIITIIINGCRRY